MRLVFNELTLKNMPQDNRKVSEIMACFMQCFAQAMKSGLNFERGILTSINFNEMMLNDALSSAHWRNIVDRDTSTAFKRICEFQVHINPLNDELELECEHGTGTGLLCAYINSDVAISLTSHPYWDSFFIDASLFDLSDESKECVRIANISKADDITANREQLDVMSLDKSLECKIPEQLLQGKDTLFPDLIFHSTAISQLRAQVQPQHMPALVKKLHEINDYFSTWRSGGFDPRKFKSKISPESSETLNMYRREHTFLYEGRDILVSYHLRYTGNIAGRVYFYPDEVARKGVICSLTTKLPTVSA